MKLQSNTQTNSRVPQPGRRLGTRGFALVVTISLLVLLLILGVGLLTLSVIQTRSSSHGKAQAEAQANARLGLLIALGELQRDLGPDRRVSATAAVLDTVPSTPQADGVVNPHWTAVWSTEWDVAVVKSGVPWNRDDTDGGFRDLRCKANPKGGYKREDKILNYLVSGNEGGKKGAGAKFLDARDARPAAEDIIKLVGEGSVAKDPVSGATGEVVAKLTRVNENDLSSGGYAYWVGDLGVKANVAVVDAHRTEKPTPKKGPEGMERILHAQDVGDELIENLGQLAETEAVKCLSDGTLALGEAIQKEGSRERFHDITTGSRSVLANVRDGGLQRDLTAYLQTTVKDGRIAALKTGSTITSPGIQDSDRLVGPESTELATVLGLSWTRCLYRDIAPRFGLLREWGVLAESLAYTKKDRDIIPPADVKDPAMIAIIEKGIDVYDKANKSPASFLPHDKTNLAPVMVEGAIYYNLAVHPKTEATGVKWVPRLCLYPRVTLWNPYNVELKLAKTVAEIFVNGNKRVRFLKADRSTEIARVDIPFGRGSGGVGDRHPGHYRGTTLWTLPAVNMAPGETIVFSAALAGEYQMADISKNALSPSVAPHPTRYYYRDYPDLKTPTVNPSPDMTALPEAPAFYSEITDTAGGEGADNYRMALKHAGTGTPTDIAYDDLPMIVHINPSLQAGGSDEPPMQWNVATPVPVHQLGSNTQVLPGGAIPDVRTRDGMRLRWWQETPSNVAASGTPLSSHPRHLQSAVIANWNPRAAYFIRTPFENVSSQRPYFYGAYTRDSFDPSVAWVDMTPRQKGGKNLGNPFGPPIEGPDAVVLYEVPRKELGIPSLGYMRHLKLSEFGWHPGYPIGNSLVDPRVGLLTTSPLLKPAEKLNYGWNQNNYGWGSGDRAGAGATYWADLFRQMLFDMPVDHVVVYDQSFEANYNLWDDFFLSTGTKAEKTKFLDEPEVNPLPNGRVGLFSTNGEAAKDVIDFHRAALRFSLLGGFNVHSTSKEAWKSILGSTADTAFASEGAVPFPRLVNPPEGEWLDGKDDDPEAMAGFRSLSEEELDRLAENIVSEVKLRAPFFGLADFVNRRLFDDATGKKGPIQAAIDSAGLNQVFDAAHPLDNSKDLPNFSFDNITDATRLNQTFQPTSTAWGLPGYLTQGDVMQVIGSSLRARSDSFVIRSYGKSVDAKGNLRAEAWCEAVVQRTPEPCRPDKTGINPLIEKGKPDFGRRFRIVSFRWLGEADV